MKSSKRKTAQYIPMEHVTLPRDKSEWHLDRQSLDGDKHWTYFDGSNSYYIDTHTDVDDQAWEDAILEHGGYSAFPTDVLVDSRDEFTSDFVGSYGSTVTNATSYLRHGTFEEGVEALEAMVNGEIDMMNRDTEYQIEKRMSRRKRVANAMVPESDFDRWVSTDSVSWFPGGSTEGILYVKVIGFEEKPDLNSAGNPYFETYADVTVFRDEYDGEGYGIGLDFPFMDDEGYADYLTMSLMDDDYYAEDGDLMVFDTVAEAMRYADSHMDTVWDAIDCDGDNLPIARVASRRSKHTNARKSSHGMHKHAWEQDEDGAIRGYTPEGYAIYSFPRRNGSWAVWVEDDKFTSLMEENFNTEDEAFAIIEGLESGEISYLPPVPARWGKKHRASLRKKAWEQVQDGNSDKLLVTGHTPEGFLITMMDNQCDDEYECITKRWHIQVFEDDEFNGLMMDEYFSTYDEAFAIIEGLESGEIRYTPPTSGKWGKRRKAAQSRKLNNWR